MDFFTLVSYLVPHLMGQLRTLLLVTGVLQVG